MQDGTLKVLVKGADSMIASLLADPNDRFLRQTQVFLKGFASSGLRTLLLAP